MGCDGILVDFHSIGVRLLVCLFLFYVIVKPPLSISSITVASPTVASTICTENKKNPPVCIGVIAAIAKQLSHCRHFSLCFLIHTLQDASPHLFSYVLCLVLSGGGVFFGRRKKVSCM